jgi:hypothetical protein
VLEPLSFLGRNGGQGTGGVQKLRQEARIVRATMERHEHGGRQARRQLAGQG